MHGQNFIDLVDTAGRRLRTVDEPIAEPQVTVAAVNLVGTIGAA